MKMTIGELRQAIAEIVTEYVSSLPPKEKVINPAAKKIGVLNPRDFMSSRPLDPSHTPKESELSDAEIENKLDLYGVDSDNVLDLLASDRNLRRDLGLGSDSKRNSDYYKRVYTIAAKKL